MEEYSDEKESEDNDKKLDIEIEDDYLLKEGTQILSDYILLNKKIYLSKAS